VGSTPIRRYPAGGRFHHDLSRAGRPGGAARPALRASGLEPGQTVAIVLPNGLEKLAVFLPVTRGRQSATPLNQGDSGSSEETPEA
jgi:hypothetical protein